MAKKEITFTAVPLIDANTYRALLDAFEAQTNIHVDLEIVEWDQYRSHFVSIALQHRHGDVATAGTPITADLIGMNALRPFTMMEIAMLGGHSAFLPSRWQSGIRLGDPQVWAIPWMLDIRVFYFWRDMLAQAGVDEQTAFTTPQNFGAAIHSLDTYSRSAGLAAAWSGPVERYTTLHTAASFIWANGGDLFAPEGKKVIFHEPEALSGLHDYYQMMRLSRDAQGPTYDNILFLERKTAVMLGNGFGDTMQTSGDLGCAPVFGSSYVGGSDLMVWEHTRSESASLELVRFLSRTDNQVRIASAARHLPLRMAALNEMAASPSPIRQTLAKAALSGRTFPCVPMVGLVEDRLSLTLLNLQQELLAHPELDIDTLVNQRVVPLGNRTNLSFNH